MRALGRLVSDFHEFISVFWMYNIWLSCLYHPVGIDLFPAASIFPSSSSEAIWFPFQSVMFIIVCRYTNIYVFMGGVLFKGKLKSSYDAVISPVDEFLPIEAKHCNERNAWTARRYVIM